MKFVPVQVFAVGICLTINMLDGFDALAIAFAAGGISDEWGLSPVELAVLFSSSLAGMTVGAFVIGPFADVIGRRPQILFCITGIGLTMLASGFSDTHTHLMLLRFLTGLGVGGVIPSLNTMVAEFSDAKWKNTALSLLHIGYPLGITVGGAGAVLLIGEYGWRSIFFLGGTLTLSMVPLVYFFLPESLEFLLHKRPNKALEKCNALLVKLGQPQLQSLPPEHHEKELKTPVGHLFSDNYLKLSIMIWTAFFVMMMTLYFIQNWLPKIMIDAGASTVEGISGGVVMSIGGIVGTGVLGIVSRWVDVVRVLQVYIVVAIGGVVSFGLLDLALFPTLVNVFVIGFVFYGGMGGLYIVGARVYPTMIRSLGVGWGIGIGRLGAVLGPYLAGVMMSMGMGKEEYFLIFSTPLVLVIIALGVIFADRRYERSAVSAM
jgi:benzoate transport